MKKIALTLLCMLLTLPSAFAQGPIYHGTFIGNGGGLTNLEGFSLPPYVLTNDEVGSVTFESTLNVGTSVTTPYVIFTAGNLASAQFLYLTIGGVPLPGTFGAGLNFSGGTLTATGVAGNGLTNGQLGTVNLQGTVNITNTNSIVLAGTNCSVLWSNASAGVQAYIETLNTTEFLINGGSYVQIYAGSSGQLAGGPWSIAGPYTFTANAGLNTSGNVNAGTLTMAGEIFANGYSNSPTSGTTNNGVGFWGNGAGLTNLPSSGGFTGNASQFNSTTATNIISGVALTNIAANGFSNNPSAGTTNNGVGFVGNGGPLTNLNATQLLSGKVPYAVLPSSVLTNANVANVTIVGNLIANGNFTSTSQGNFTDMLGTTALVVTSGTPSAASLATFSGGGNSIVMDNTADLTLNGGNLIVSGGNLTASGANLTALNATQLTSGTVPSGALGLAALLAGNNVFTGQNTFTNLNGVPITVEAVPGHDFIDFLTNGLLQAAVDQWGHYKSERGSLAHVAFGVQSDPFDGFYFPSNSASSNQVAALVNGAVAELWSNGPSIYLPWISTAGILAVAANGQLSQTTTPSVSALTVNGYNVNAPAYTVVLSGSNVFINATNPGALYRVATPSTLGNVLVLWPPTNGYDGETIKVDVRQNTSFPTNTIFFTNTSSGLVNQNYPATNSVFPYEVPQQVIILNTNAGSWTHLVATFNAVTTNWFWSGPLSTAQ